MPASGATSFEDLLASASKQAGKYEWMASADLYHRALERSDPNRDPLETGRITELLAKSYFKAAFQAGTRNEFKVRMKLAEASYEGARVTYENAGLEPLSKRSNARSLYATFWLEDDVAIRRDIAERCVGSCREAWRFYEQQGDRIERGQTLRDLLRYLRQSFVIARERQGLLDYLAEATQLGLDALNTIEGQPTDEALVESLNVLAQFLEESFYLLKPLEFNQLKTRAKGLRGRIAEISEEIGTPRARCLAQEAIALFDPPGRKALEIWESALTVARDVKETYLIGRLALQASVSATWGGLAEEDSQERRVLFEKAQQYGALAIENLKVSTSHGYLDWAYAFHADAHLRLGAWLETDAETKRMHLRQAVAIGEEGMVYNSSSWIRLVSGELGKAKYYLATLESNPEEKKRLLSESLKIHEEEGRVHSEITPYNWNRGVLLNYSALVKSELSTIEENHEAKVEFLRGAVADSQLSIEVCSQWATNPSMMRSVSKYHEWHGDILFQLYRHMADRITAQQAVEAYENAIDYGTRAGQVAAIAPIRWKLASVLDSSGDLLEASRNFNKAADDYKLGAEKVPSLAPAYLNLSSYMKAWSLIEDARLRHEEEQYPAAAENYESAANILKETVMWGHISTHYKACSLLEQGEIPSREEKHDVSKETFAKAAEIFQAAKEGLAKKLGEATDSQEKQELENWLGVTDGRQRYAKGRSQLEDAQIFDRKGQKEASVERYRSASTIFSALLGEAQNERSRRELETLALFCEAWAKMKEADAKASPELYGEAGQLFVRIQDSAVREKLGRQALANAAICRALESGSRFRITRDTGLYADIKKNLESAADYYEEAGLRNAADWTRATQRMFDALVYLADAETERETKKRTELYHLAEKHLELASKLYSQSGFSSKKDEALRHLTRAREEKELLLTPLEALSRDPASQGVAVAPVSLIREQALGLERFESANVVGNLTLDPKELSVGSDITLELELANVGKKVATLLRLEGISMSGLEIDKEKVAHKIKDGTVDLKGRRLEHLDTYEVKVPMKATRKGSIELRPKVLFVDEKGNQRSYEFEPALLTARELGISGWMKGPK